MNTEHLRELRLRERQDLGTPVDLERLTGVRAVGGWVSVFIRVDRRRGPMRVAGQLVQRLRFTTTKP